MKKMKQVPYKDSHKVVGFNPLVITKAQFCRMMSHVLSSLRNNLSHAGFLCLYRLE